MHRSSGSKAATTGLEALTCVKDKRIALISHDLSQSGSPLLLVEVAAKLRTAGANVCLVTLADDARKSDLAARNQIPVLRTADSFAYCADSDLVIANTAVSRVWVDRYLERYPDGRRLLIWWIHEIDAASYAPRMSSLGRAAMALFDSHASLRNWTATGLCLPPVSQVLHPAVDHAFLDRASRPLVPGPRPSLLERLGLVVGHTRETIRAQLGIGSDDFVLTLIGWYKLSKGHTLLVRTISCMMRENPDLPLKLLLVGFHDKGQKAAFMAALDDAGRKVLDDRRALTVKQDLGPYYAASDAFVMNSQELGENFGRVTIEAMAYRLPILGTRAGGTPEIVEDGVTGLLHPVGVEGQDALAKNILTLLANRQQARTMGEAGYLRVQEQFTSRRFYPELGQLLATILAREPVDSFASTLRL